MNPVLLSTAETSIKKMNLLNFSFRYKLVKCEADLVLTQ